MAFSYAKQTLRDIFRYGAYTRIWIYIPGIRYINVYNLKAVLQVFNIIAFIIVLSSKKRKKKYLSLLSFFKTIIYAYQFSF